MCFVNFATVQGILLCSNCNSVFVLRMKHQPCSLRTYNALKAVHVLIRLLNDAFLLTNVIWLNSKAIWMINSKLCVKNRPLRVSRSPPGEMKENTKILNPGLRFPIQDSKMVLSKYETKNLTTKFSAPVKTNPFKTDICSLSVNSLIEK
jgi:hypothetical protein